MKGVIKIGDRIVGTLKEIDYGRPAVDHTRRVADPFDLVHAACGAAPGNSHGDMIRDIVLGALEAPDGFSIGIRMTTVVLIDVEVRHGR